MDLVSTSGAMAMSTKENGELVCAMVREVTNSLWAICTLESIFGEKLTVMANTLGQMEVFTKENLERARKKARVFGSKVQARVQISIRVSMSMTESMAMVNSFGNQEVNIKASTLEIKSKGMVRCTGWMEVFTRDFGRKGFRVR
jgi:hypothetical protein